MATYNLLRHISDYLIAQNLVRDPKVAGPQTGGPYPLWLEPRLGAPGPRGEKEAVEVWTNDDMAVSAYRDGGIPPPRGAPWRTLFVEFWLRSKNPPIAFAFWDSLIPHFQADSPSGNPRQAYDLAGLFIMESVMIRELGRLQSDDQAFTYSGAFSFTTYA